MQTSIARRPHRPFLGHETAPDSALAVRTHGLTKLYRNPWTLRVARGIEDRLVRVLEAGQPPRDLEKHVLARLEALGADSWLIGFIQK